MDLPYDYDAEKTGKNPLRFAPDVSLFVYDYDQLSSDDFLGVPQPSVLFLAYWLLRAFKCTFARTPSSGGRMDAERQAAAAHQCGTGQLH